VFEVIAVDPNGLKIGFRASRGHVTVLSSGLSLKYVYSTDLDQLALYSSRSFKEGFGVAQRMAAYVVGVLNEARYKGRVLDKTSILIEYLLVEKRCGNADDGLFVVVYILIECRKDDGLDFFLRFFLPNAIHLPVEF
jgi:hypothetical protein